VSWSDYIVNVAAPHSRGSAKHWFRYLRKYIDKCGVLFSEKDIEELYRNEVLTPFQRVSLRAAFCEGSPTQQHVISLNSKAERNKILSVRKKYEKIDSCRQ